MEGNHSINQNPLNPKPTGLAKGKNGFRIGLIFLCGIAAFTHFLVAASSPAPALSPKDVALLDEIEKRAVLFFVEQTDPNSGLTRDRAPANGNPSNARSSVAATGFALTAWGIAAERGWMPHEAARRHVVTTLRFMIERVDHSRGWLYHFVTIEEGRRAWESEASTIDTALFLQGALFAREYFKDSEINKLVDRLYSRIDWNWALNGGKTLSHGWRPESGFISSRWDSYAEMLGLYLLGIGAPEHPPPASTW
ncbi:MAG: hypothetical protein WC378_01685, partial [Opitutaceae bacterium]